MARLTIKLSTLEHITLQRLARAEKRTLQAQAAMLIKRALMPPARPSTDQKAPVLFQTESSSSELGNGSSDSSHVFTHDQTSDLTA